MLTWDVLTFASFKETVLSPVESVEKFPIIFASATLQNSRKTKTIATALFKMLSLS